MKTKAALVLAAGLFLAICMAAPVGDENQLVDEKGTIQKVREEWYAIMPDSDPGTRYAPKNLNADFKQDGLRVRFSGKILEIEAGQRQWGTPLELTRIERLQE